MRCSQTGILVKWLTSGSVLAKITKNTQIHKTIPAGRPIVSGRVGPKECISSFVDSLLPGQSHKNESYIEDTTHKSDIIENTPLPDEAI